MLFTTSANPGREQQQSWLRMAVTGRQHRVTCRAEREGEAVLSNEWTVIYEEGAEHEGRWGGCFASADFSNPDFIIAVL